MSSILLDATQQVAAKDIAMKEVKCLTVFFILLGSVSTSASVWGPDNFWECILEELPGVKNDAAARELLLLCKKEYPNTYIVEKKAPVFGISTAGECVIEHAKDVTSRKGAMAIRSACYKIYPKE